MLVVGPSGVGKDTLIDYCRTRLAGDDRVVFSRRAVTRPVGGDAEDHESVSEAEFRQRLARGAFTIHWQAHGLHYGVSVSIDEDLTAGRTVVVNASRSVIDATRLRYRPLTVVLVTAERHVVTERLRRRGRETCADIDRRVARADALPVEGDDVVRLDNSGAIEDAGEAMLKILIGRAD